MRRRVLLASLFATPALAQGNWPARSVEIVAPYAAGGPTDRYAREFAARLTERWGQSVVVSNKPGGATAIGTAAVANAAPDGYTLLLASFGIVTNPIMLKNLPYDPKALAPLCRIAHRAPGDPRTDRARVPRPAAGSARRADHGD